MACRKNSPGKPCCGPPDCESCCIERIEIVFGKQDGVDGQIGTFDWSISEQPDNTFSTDVMPDGKTQQVCNRVYYAPFSETICEGTAKELSINGRFTTLNRVFPSMSGRYGAITGNVDFTGTTGVRTNVFVYGLFVLVQNSFGWNKVVVGSYGIEEYFGYVSEGSTFRSYDYGTCLGTGPTSTYGPPPESMYETCYGSAFNAVCPGLNISLGMPYGYRDGGSGMPLPALNTGWVASESCPSGEYISGEYAFFEYFGTNPSLSACRLPYTREYYALGGSPCGWGYVNETRRSLDDSYTLMRNTVTLTTCD